jgi:hypothetical protein
MKKKSAKLLSKLSVNSTNCNLVKSLVKQDNNLVINDKEQQITQLLTSAELNESLGLKLKVEDDFQLSGTNGIMLANSNFSHINSLAAIVTNGAQDNSKLNAFIENFDEAEYDWFNAIEFKFDAATSKSIQFQELAGFLQKKIFEKQEKNKKKAVNENAR